MDESPRYREVLDKLQARGRFGIRLGLGRTRALLRRLGDPHVGMRGVLIGGTNGKGSVQALVSSVLREAGHRVGQTPKPHLVSYRERILVDGTPISEDDFADLVDEVIRHADAVAPRLGAPTEFEVLTAAAFTWFRRAGVEVAVVEVGMGGRLDATNVWQGGVTAITNVALDHMEYLGDTVEKIAREKAAIIKRGDHRAVTAAAEPALAVIKRRAERVGVMLEVAAPLKVTAVDREVVHAVAIDGQPIDIGLLGRHQATNAAVAIGIVDAMNDAGITSVSRDQHYGGFAKARWPGRMELINRRGEPDILLDGAHNPHGVAALADSLRELLPQMTAGSPTFLTGVIANHWQEGMLDPLLDVVPSGALIATRVPGSPSSMEPGKLAASWGAGATHIADPARALDSAMRRATQVSGPLIVCGSLYLVGYVREQLLGPGPAV